MEDKVVVLGQKKCCGFVSPWIPPRLAIELAESEIEQRVALLNRWFHILNRYGYAIATDPDTGQKCFDWKYFHPDSAKRLAAIICPHIAAMYCYTAVKIDPNLSIQQSTPIDD